MNLKIGGSNVGKIMYNGQEFGGTTKLEPGTVLYITKSETDSFENVHLLSTTKNWSNIDGINIRTYYSDLRVRGGFDIVDDDFKNLDTEKEYPDNFGHKITVSISIVDGEYRLNASGFGDNKTAISAI